MLIAEGRNKLAAISESCATHSLLLVPVFSSCGFLPHIFFQVMSRFRDSHVLFSFHQSPDTSRSGTQRRAARAWRAWRASRLLSSGALGARVAINALVGPWKCRITCPLAQVHEVGSSLSCVRLVQCGAAMQRRVVRAFMR